MVAGEYTSRCLWQSHAYGSPDQYGAKADAWAGTQYLWCEIKGKTDQFETVLEDRRNTVRATLHVRGWVAVKPLDRLTDSHFGEVWQVESVYKDREGYETVCSCYLTDGVKR